MEATIYNRHSLEKSYQLNLRSAQHAMNHYSISFEQYQKGLVTYNIVLESQKRSFEIQSSVIRLNDALLQNSTHLYKALGGNVSLKIQLYQ